MRPQRLGESREGRRLAETGAGGRHGHGHGHGHGRERGLMMGGNMSAKGTESVFQEKLQIDILW